MKPYYTAYEERVADELGGRVRPRSGAGLDKGDVITPMILNSCKTAPKRFPRSFKLTLDDWEEIEHLAALEGLIPALSIGFTELSLTAMKTEDVAGLQEEAKLYKERFKQERKKVKRLEKELASLQRDLNESN